MDKRNRIYSQEGTSIRVPVRYDEQAKRYLSDFPDFEQSPVYTEQGHPWVDAAGDACRYAENVQEGKVCIDCGSCRYYRVERAGDLIGTCIQENNTIEINAEKEGTGV